MSIHYLRSILSYSWQHRISASCSPSSYNILFHPPLWLRSHPGNYKKEGCTIEDCLEIRTFWYLSLSFLPDGSQLKRFALSSLNGYSISRGVEEFWEDTEPYPDQSLHSGPWGPTNAVSIFFLYFSHKNLVQCCYTLPLWSLKTCNLFPVPAGDSHWWWSFCSTLHRYRRFRLSHCNASSEGKPPHQGCFQKENSISHPVSGGMKLHLLSFLAILSCGKIFSQAAGSQIGHTEHHHKDFDQQIQGSGEFYNRF